MKVFRWLMVLPGSLLAAMLGSLAGGIVLRIFGSQSLMDAGSAFLGSFSFAFAAGLIAPRKRSKTTLAFAVVIAFLALLAFVLSICTNIEGFADRRTLDKILIPVAQILGALYALVLLPPVVIPGTTLEQLWREINVLGATVVLLGILISLVGLLVGLLARTWVGLTTGLGVLAIGSATWLFPWIHLLLRFRRFEANMGELLRRRNDLTDDAGLQKNDLPTKMSGGGAQ